MQRLQLSGESTRLGVSLVLVMGPHSSYFFRFITCLAAILASRALPRCAWTTSGPSNCVGPPRSTCSATADTSSGSTGGATSAQFKPKSQRFYLLCEIVKAINVEREKFQSYFHVQVHVSAKNTSALVCVWQVVNHAQFLQSGVEGWRGGGD